MKGLTLIERTKTDLGGFYLESDFFDGDNFYVNAVLTESATSDRIARASEMVHDVAVQIAYAMNGVEGVNEHDDGAWVVYDEEWWDVDGNIVDDEDEYGTVRIVQRTIRK